LTPDPAPASHTSPWPAGKGLFPTWRRLSTTASVEPRFRTRTSLTSGTSVRATFGAGPGVALSMKTSFGGPLVAQNVARTTDSTTRGGGAGTRNMPANYAVRRRLSSGVVMSDSACHAGGRGLESRRSRLSECLQMGTLRCLTRPNQQSSRQQTGSTRLQQRRAAATKSLQIGSSCWQPCIEGVERTDAQRCPARASNE
jgi:hypothetical protein